MKICLICGEFFAWGKYGGFGRAARTLGRELVRRGHEVSAVVPRRGGQKPFETLDGIAVHSFTPWNQLHAFRLYRDRDADLFHSQEPSLGTWLAMRAHPRRRHVVTLRDTREKGDWRIESQLPSTHRLGTSITRLYENNPLVHRAVRRADAVYCASQVVGERGRRLYRLPQPPPLLPTPVAIPARVEKASTPTVCYVGRMNRRKRPELFFQLAAQFPEVKFIALGQPRDEAWFASLFARYRHLPNLVYGGFADPFSSDLLHQTYSAAWILINPALREGLPNTYLEAAAHGCALLSRTNPDELPSRFGCHVPDDQFAQGLRWLLENNRWREKGQAGRRHVQAQFGMEHAMGLHLEAYNRAMNPG